MYFFSVYGCMLCLVCYLFVISTSVIDCLGRFVPEMTFYVSSGTLNLIKLTPVWNQFDMDLNWRGWSKSGGQIVGSDTRVYHGNQLPVVLPVYLSHW